MVFAIPFFCFFNKNLLNNICFSHAERRNAASFRPIARLTLQYMQVRSAKAGRLFISY